MKFLSKLFYVGCFLFLSSIVNAGSPVYFPQSTNAFSIYTVGDSTTTTATYTITNTSITFTTTGGADGLYNGSTYYLLTGDICGNTIDSFITFINDLSTTTVGAIGGIVATKAKNVYGGNLLSGLTAVGETSCLGSENEADLSLTTVYGLSYVIDAGENSIYLEEITANATFGSGTTYVTVYDGDNTADILYKGKVTTTAVDREFNLPKEGIRGSVKNSVRLDLVGTAAITNSYMDINYSRKK